ncbi:GNAT family N-acetyltransferase [Arthrobacter sp. M4]|uniref:GNAT family N-acetyltransferase n=1 Tax=Arthrobacter sp. M4 TaxID=218160 RepID=UPI001CDCE5E5|nr:GNAT family N-acetyltransferase [Arthrobacter sp. M4]MCA4133752.1 GNAT family N-acetyltransferase [Arthrobacter sp. M4]
MLSKVAPWLASRSDTAVRPGLSVRELTGLDTDTLRQLALTDEVANVFILAHLETSGTAAPTQGGARVYGVFDGIELIGACWAGANLVPVQLAPDLAGYVAMAAHQSGRRFASIFGPADAVLALYSRLEQLGHYAHEVRAHQPLLVLSGLPAVSPNPNLGFGDMADFDRILPACAAMFEEEVGYSPFLGGKEYYSRRIAGLIRQRHSLVHLDEVGNVIFKAELGAVTSGVTQVQGVWMNPDYRGLGLSAGYMAAVVALSREFAPITSLYVNDYNTRARATYERVGFSQRGTFATVLF